MSETEKQKEKISELEKNVKKQLWKYQSTLNANEKQIKRLRDKVLETQDTTSALAVVQAREEENKIIALQVARLQQLLSALTQQKVNLDYDVLVKEFKEVCVANKDAQGPEGFSAEEQEHLLQMEMEAIDNYLPQVPSVSTTATTTTTIGTSVHTFQNEAENKSHV